MWIYRPIDERKDIFARSIEFSYINKVTSTLDGVVLFEGINTQTLLLAFICSHIVTGILITLSFPQMSEGLTNRCTVGRRLVGEKMHWLGVSESDSVVFT